MAVYFSLDTQFENLGDEVINSLLLREIAQRDALELLVGNAPDWYSANVAQAIGRTAHEVKFVRNRKQYMRNFLLGSLFPPGNTMLLSCGDVSPRKPNTQRARMMNFLSRLPFLNVAQIGASRLNVVETDKLWLQRAARRSAKFSMRDAYSVQTLKAAGVDALMHPDLAFLLEFKNAGGGDKALFMFRESDADDAEVAAQLPMLTTKARQLGLTPVFGWQVARDEPYNRRLADLVQADVFALPGNMEERLEPTLECYDHVAMIVSNRLHGLLLAASRGALPVPLLSDKERKVRGVFEQAELYDFILNAGIEPSLNAETLSDLFAHRDAHVLRIERTFAANAAQLRHGFDAFFGPRAGSK
jgi:hypothetical protein